MTARWQLDPAFTAKAGAGLFVQEPDVTQGENDPVFGNPGLRAERARHYSMGFEWKPLPQLTVDLTGFYKDLRRLISRTEDIDVVDGMPRPLIYDNRGRGRVYGTELVARHDLANNFTGWLAYTLSRSLRTDSNAPRERLFDFDQTHILTAVASYLLPRNWQVGGRFRLVSGNPRTPVVAAVYNASSDRYEATFGPVNSARNAPFHQLDLRVDKRWIYQDWMLNLYLDIQNVYNRANPEGLQYKFDFSDARVQQGLPILTILGIRGEF
jgi:outer membrane receptor protein involved in Fe transport